MKCYEHTDSDAVAQCRSCMKYLCKSCYDCSQDGICSECIREEEQANLEYKEASKKRYINEIKHSYKNYRRKVAISGLIGFIVGIIILINLPIETNIEFIYGLILIIFSSFFGIALYSGYIILRKMPDMPKIGIFEDINFILSLIYQMIKIPIALIAGIFGAIPLFIKKKQEYEKINT